MNDRFSQRRTQGKYSNEARRRIVRMQQNISPDRRLLPCVASWPVAMFLGFLPLAFVSSYNCEKSYRGTNAA